MRRISLFTLDTPYREPLTIWGYEFGRADAQKSVAIVGSMRGNEVEQTYVCADLVRRLCALEEKGAMDPGRRVLVVPSVNAFSMNISERFWPVDNTDINRMFPGYDLGETTQRIADGLFRAVQGYDYGIQLCSFYLPGDFQPHVRVTETGQITQESLELAGAFGFPYVVAKKPSSFDTTTLNYNWQVWGTHAFSVFVRDMGSLSTRNADEVEDCILRFLDDRGVVKFTLPGGFRSTCLEEAGLVDVRCERAGGFFLRDVEPGERVRAGQTLGQVLDTGDAHVKEMLASPVDGRVFFCHVAPLINQYTIAFKIAPETSWSHSQ